MTLDYLLWFFMVLATTYVITESFIFRPIRVLITAGSFFRRTFLYCPSCVGFWVGVFYALLGYWPLEYGSQMWPTLRECFESGCGSLVIGMLWSMSSASGNAFVVEADLRGEDPETFIPRVEDTEDEEEEAPDDEA